MFGSKKKLPRCFEREMEELVNEEKTQFPNEFDDIPMNLSISIDVLEKQNFKQGKESFL
jgi:hypothetical protein